MRSGRNERKAPMFFANIINRSIRHLTDVWLTAPSMVNLRYHRLTIMSNGRRIIIIAISFLFHQRISLKYDGVCHEMKEKTLLSFRWINHWLRISIHRMRWWITLVCHHLQRPQLPFFPQPYRRLLLSIHWIPVQQDHPTIYPSLPLRTLSLRML